MFSVLSEDATQSQTFEQVATSLHHYFNNKSDYFKIGQALVSVLFFVVMNWKTCKNHIVPCHCYY